MKNKITFFFTAIVIFFSSTTGFSQNSSYEVGTWEGFRTAAVAFTFDDACANQFTLAVPIFDGYGYKASFYPVIDWGPNWGTLKTLANNGHEIGSHSKTHPDGAMNENEMSSSKNEINKNITGFDCNTVVYPNCRVPDKTTTAKYFIGGRICNNQIEKTTPTDYFEIGSVICGNKGPCNSFLNFQTELNTAKNNNGWAVFLIHGINSESDGYSPLAADVIESTLNHIQQNDGDFWVTTFRNAILYSKERNAANINEITNTANEITLTVTDNLDNNVYKYPLSIRRAIPAGWTDVTAIQDGNEIEANIRNGYIYFSAVPDGGTIVLTPGTPVSGFAISTSVFPETGGSVTVSPNPTANGRYEEGETVTLTPVPSTNWEFDGWSGDVSGNDAPLSITMDKDVAVTAKFVLVGDDVDNNLIKNGTFAGTDNWTFGQHENAAGTFTATGNEGTIAVTTLGADDHNVQITQNGIPLETGTKFRLTFDASAAAAREMSMFMQMDVSPWTEYYVEVINLTGQNQSFSFEFEMTEATDMNGRIAFNVGTATPTVKISNVQLIRIKEFGGTSPKVTLTLDANGGTVTPGTISVEEGAAIGTLPVPTRPGYSFEGWFDREKVEYGADTELTADETVTAAWRATGENLTEPELLELIGELTEQVGQLASQKDNLEQLLYECGMSTSNEILRTASDMLTVYPNPVNANSVLNIESANLKAGDKMEIFDMKGRLISVDTATGDAVTSIKIGSLSQGTYLLRLAEQRGVKFEVK